VYKDTITLFNRKEGEEGDTWFPSVLRNVHVNTDRAAIMAKYGAESADSSSLHIRYRKVDGEIMVGEKRWEPPKEWDKLLDKTGVITFTPGDRFDFFMLGDWGSEEPVYDWEYNGTATSGFYAYMNKNYDGVFAISSVGGPYSVIPHFEIIGK